MKILSGILKLVNEKKKPLSAAMASPHKPAHWLQVLYAGWLLGMTVPLLVVQGLSFVRWFTVSRALILSLVLLPIVAWAYASEGFPNLSPLFWKPSRLAQWIWGALGMEIALLVLVPLFVWPYTILGKFLPWDLIYYHLPKAADLIQKGHMWNLTVPYGQYPLGWEGLLALSFKEGTPLAAGVGPAFGLAVVGLMVGVILLLQRETAWPVSWAVIIVSVMFFGFYLPVPNNPWRIFGLLIAEGIGKNDFFAAALVVSALYHLPAVREGGKGRLHATGYGLSLGAALATKPNIGGAVLLLLLWLMAWKPALLSTARRRWVWALWGITGSMGLLWLVRNMFLMGRPFSPVIAVLRRQSILYTWHHAAFWHPLPKVFLFLGVQLFVISIWAWYRPGWRWGVGTAWLLFVLFLVTPAVTGHAGRIDWRFGLPLLVWTWVLTFAALSDVLTVLATQRRFVSLLPWLQHAGVLLSLIFCIGSGLWMAHRYAHFLQWRPEYARILYDPFSAPVGTEGYRSAIDYIHRRVRHATIESEEMPFYYVYDFGLTNRPVRPGVFPGGLPGAVNQPVPDHWLYCNVQWDWHAWASPKTPDAVHDVARQWVTLGRQIIYIDQACVLARAP